MERPIIDYPGAVNLWLNTWIAEHPTRTAFLWYGAAFLLACVAILGTSPRLRGIPHRVRSWLEKDLVFLAAVSGLTLILRLPLLAVLQELNVDESQWIAGAATLVNDWRFWLSVDGHTSGPVNVFPLSMVYYLGGSLNYGSVRLWATLVCVIPSFFLLFYTLRQDFDARAAKLLLLPLVAFFAFPAHPDLVAYNSEHVPMLLTATVLFLAVSTLKGESRATVTAAACGFTLGCFPYSKLQAAPIGLVAGIFVLGVLLLRRDVKRSAVLVLSAAVPTIAVLVAVWSYGGLQDFWLSYLVTNLQYTTGEFPGSLTGSFLGKLPVLGTLLRVTQTQMAPLLLVFLIGVIMFARRTVGRPPQRVLNRALLLALLLLVAAVYGIVTPGNPFGHYMVLLVVPLAFASAQLIGPEVFAAGRQSVRFGIITASVGLPLFLSLRSEPIGINPGGRTIKGLEVGNAIRKYQPANSRLAVWGWEPRLYVFSGSIQAVREAHTHYQITPSTQQGYYIGRYLGDLMRTQPKVFVDGAWQGANPFHSGFRADRIREVAGFLERYYALQEEVKGARIYIRK